MRSAELTLKQKHRLNVMQTCLSVLGNHHHQDLQEDHNCLLIQMGLELQDYQITLLNLSDHGQGAQQLPSHLSDRGSL